MSFDGRAAVMNRLDREAASQAKWLEQELSFLRQKIGVALAALADGEAVDESLLGNAPSLAATIARRNLALDVAAMARVAFEHEEG